VLEVCVIVFAEEDKTHGKMFVPLFIFISSPSFRLSSLVFFFSFWPTFAAISVFVCPAGFEDGNCFQIFTSDFISVSFVKLIRLQLSVVSSWVSFFASFPVIAVVVVQRGCGHFCCRALLFFSPPPSFGCWAYYFTFVF
jgi:hypothetical protein